MLTVACVFKEKRPPRIGGLCGSVYDDSWVGKLARGVARHLSRPHRFVCLTDADLPGVETIPLVHGWDGWWSKIELFRPGQFDGPVLYMDLDVMVTGDIDPLGGPFDGIVLLEEPGVVNSTCMWWDGSNPAYQTIYRTFAADVAGEAASRQNWQSTDGLGDQALITSVLDRQGLSHTTWQRLLDPCGFVPFSFRSNVCAEVKNGTPKGSRLVYCLGAPKFDAYPHLDVVQRNWI